MHHFPEIMQNNEVMQPIRLKKSLKVLITWLGDRG